MMMTELGVTRTLSALKESGQQRVDAFLKRFSEDLSEDSARVDLVLMHRIGIFVCIDNLLSSVPLKLSTSVGGI